MKLFLDVSLSFQIAIKTQPISEYAVLKLFNGKYSTANLVVTFLLLGTSSLAIL